MPIYRYECRKCGKEFTKMMSISDVKDSLDCEVCSGEAKRVIKNIGISFKGSGYYINDSKKSSSSKSNSSCKSCPAATN